MTDVLKRPVHVALLRPTELEKLAEKGKLHATPYGVDPSASEQPLPKAVKERPPKLGIPKAANYTKEAKKKLQLKVLHESVPPIPADKIPPCDTCKTAACCHVFIVNITELEYESGVYGDAAIKFTPEMHRQLTPRGWRASSEPTYRLEGRIGEPCPFLTADAKCGIYEHRPRTCRAYTCVGDSRITEGMRQGTEPIDTLSSLEKIQDQLNGNRG